MLSSFEGRDLVGDSGESLYLKIKITEQDRPLIRTYLEQAARSLEEGMSKIITSSAYSEEGFVWEVRTEDTRWNVNTGREPVGRSGWLFHDELAF